MLFVIFRGFVFILAAVVAYGAGAPAEEGLRAMPFAGRAGLRIAAGLAILSSLFFLLALAGRLDRAAIAIVAAACVVAALAGIRRSRERRAPGLYPLLFAAALLTFLAGFAMTLYPPTAFDETLYHLPTIRRFAESASMPFIGTLRAPVFPNAFEALAVPLYLLGGDTMTHLLPLLAASATALIVFSAAAEEGGRSAGWIALSMFVSSPIVFALAATGYVESLLTLFVAAALRCFERWKDEQATRWLCGAALFAGAAASVKYLGLFWVAVLAAGVAALARRGRARAFLMFCAGVFVVLLPWYARIVHHTGNPLFPYLPGLFGHSVWDPSPIPRAEGFGRWVADFVRIPWDAVFARGRVNQQPPFSPWLLVAIPLVAARAIANRRARAVLAVCMLWAIVWTALPRDSRYLTVLLPLVSVEIGLAAAPITRALGRWSLLAVCVLLALTGLLYAAYRIRLQGPVPTDAASRDRFLGGRIPGYGGIAFLNRESGPGDVAFVCGGEQLAGYYRGTMIGDISGPAGYERILSSGDAAERARRLDALGVRYVLVLRGRCPSAPWSGPDAGEWYAKLRSDDESDVYVRKGR